MAADQRQQQKTLSFEAFYREHFLLEHSHPGNIALHVFGTCASLAFLPYILLYHSPWFLLLYPLVNAVPGLLGHKLFEPNLQVGDIRVFRNDFPKYWFLVANHKLTLQVLSGQFKRRQD